MTTVRTIWLAPPACGFRAARPSCPTLAIGSIALAGLSFLVLPHGIAFDPWSWLVWGREVLNLDLDTRTAATSMKPLPLAVTTLLAPTGSAAPVLWLLVARAGAIAGVGMAWRVADRLAGPFAGALAAVGLLTADQYASVLFMTGMATPIAAATALLSVDAALSGRHRLAIGALLATALLRLEAWPFVLLYLAWRLRHRCTAGRFVGAVLTLLVLPAAWFGPDWFGSRQLLRSASASSQQSQGGPLLSSVPGLATVTETVHLLAVPLVVGFITTAVVGSVVAVRRREPLAVHLTVLAAAALGWLAVVATMAQLRIATGAIRYLLPGAAVADVVAAVGIWIAAKWLLRRVSAATPARAGRAAATAGVLGIALSVGMVPKVILASTGAAHEVRVDRHLERLKDGVVPALAVDDGAPARCAPVSTTPLQLPMVAWVTGRHLEQIATLPGARGTVLSEGNSPLPVAAVKNGYRQVGTAGTGNAVWKVLTTC